MQRWMPKGEGLPRVCAHRGASAHARENTIEAAAMAHAQGATWIEFDVRPCADGLVVHHDPVTSDGVVISDVAHADLGDHIPSFEDFVSACGPLGLDIELKTDGIGITIEQFVDRAAAAVDALDRSGPGEVIVTSFDQHALDTMRTTRPGLPTGVLFHDRSASWAIERAVAHGHRAIAPWYPLVDEALVAAAHAAGLAVMTWTVNDPVDMRTMADLGVDMVIGDDPGQLVEVIGA